MGLLGGKVDVLFFDVTTLSFASDSEDELRKKGYSKDGKVQVALIQTRQGLDERFAGNTTDVKTLDPAIAPLQQRFALGKVVFVADAGMMSQENLTLLLSKGYDFVMAARLRSLGKKATREVTAVQEWQPMGKDRMVAERRLVLRTCPKKAAKDAHDRERALEKARLNLAQGVKGKGGSGRFLDQGAVSLNEEAIEKDQAFGGLHGLYTSLETLAPQEVSAQSCGG